MSFKSAAYVVVARTFKLLDSNGFTRIFFGRFTNTFLLSDYYGFEYQSPGYAATAESNIGFRDNVDPGIALFTQGTADTRTWIDNRSSSSGGGSSVTINAEDLSASNAATIQLIASPLSGAALVSATDSVTVDGGNVSLVANVADVTYNGIQVAIIETSSADVPALTGMTIGGAGGVNVLQWRYVGGPDSGDVGVLFGFGTITFGAGAVLPVAPTIGIPAAFTIASGSNLRSWGWAYFADASAPANDRIGTIFTNNVNSVRPLVSGYTAALATLAAAVPIVWAVGDSIFYEYNIPVVRV